MHIASLLNTLLLLSCMQAAHASLITIGSPSLISAYHSGVGLAESASFAGAPVQVGTTAGTEYSSAQIQGLSSQSGDNALELLITIFRQQRNDDIFSNGNVSIGGFGQTIFTVADAATDISFRLYGGYQISNFAGYNTGPGTPKSIFLSSSIFDITGPTETLVASVSNSVQDAENEVDVSGDLMAGHTYRWTFNASTIGKTSSFDFGTLSIQLNGTLAVNEVSEPSSLLSLALGGGLIAAVRIRRCKARSRSF